MEKKLGVLFTIVARPLFINTSLSIIPSSNPSKHVQTTLFFSSFSLHYTHSCFYLSIPRTLYFSPSITPATICSSALSRDFLCAYGSLLARFHIKSCHSNSLIFGREPETLMHYVAGMLSTRLNN